MSVISLNACLTSDRARAGVEVTIGGRLPRSLGVRSTYRPSDGMGGAIDRNWAWRPGGRVPEGVRLPKRSERPDSSSGPRASSRLCRCAGRQPCWEPHVDETLRADDGARSSGAIGDHQGVRRGRDVVNALRKFITGHADAMWDAHRAIFLEAAGVEHDDVRPRIENRLHLFHRQQRRVADRLD